MNRSLRLFALLNILFLGLPALADDINQTELTEKMAKENPPLILDVRSIEEYAKSHIPGAINIPHKVISDNLEEILGHKDKEVIIYCRSGRRADIAKKVLEDQGFSNVRNLTGHFNAWSENNMAVESKTTQYN